MASPRVLCSSVYDRLAAGLSPVWLVSASAATDALHATTVARAADRTDRATIDRRGGWCPCGSRGWSRFTSPPNNRVQAAADDATSGLTLSGDDLDLAERLHVTREIGRASRHVVLRQQIAHDIDVVFDGEAARPRLGHRRRNGSDQVRQRHPTPSLKQGRIERALPGQRRGPAEPIVKEPAPEIFLMAITALGLEHLLATPSL